MDEIMETSTLALIIGGISAFASLGIYSANKEKHRADLEKEEERKRAEYYPLIALSLSNEDSEFSVVVKNNSGKNKGLIEKVDMVGCFIRDYMNVPLEMSERLDFEVKPDEKISIPLSCLNRRLKEIEPVLYNFKPEIPPREFWFRFRIFYSPAVDMVNDDRAKVMEVKLSVDIKNKMLKILSAKQTN